MCVAGQGSACGVCVAGQGSACGVCVTGQLSGVWCVCGRSGVQRRGVCCGRSGSASGVVCV